MIRCGELIPLVRYFYFILEVSGINKNELMVNEEIRAEQVRLIGDDGSLVGTCHQKEAPIAYQKNLDMVMIALAAKSAGMQNYYGLQQIRI